MIINLHNSTEGEPVVGGDGEADAVLGLGSVQDLHVGSHPRVGRHRGKGPVQLLEDLQLHAEDLLLGARAVGHVGELLQLRRVDLLKLGADKQAGHADQLQAVLGDGSGGAEVPVKEVNRQVEGFTV